MARPVVSIIVPAYNAEATLRETLLSVLASTYRDFELLVVDDGSRDSTAEIAQEMARTDERVQLLRQSNKGLSAALNAALSRARGDYIARLDADDVWHSSKLEKQVELAFRDPELAFIYCWIRYVDQQGRVVRDAPAQQFPRFALCRGVYESLIGGGSSALMKRSAIVEVGGWDESMKSWMDLLLQLCICTRHPIGFVPEFLAGYRIGHDTLSSDPSRMVRMWRAARRRLQQQHSQVPDYVYRWAHGTRCLLFAESHAWRGRYWGCVRLAVEALLHDPKFTLRFFAYRLFRHLKRRAVSGQAARLNAHFNDCDPREHIRNADYESGSEGAPLRRLERQRMRHLAAIDRKLAEILAVTPRLLAAVDEGSSPAAPARP